MPSSFSVYILLFFFSAARLLAPFCGFGGAPLLFGFFDFDTPSLWGFVLVLLFRIPDLFVACFDFTVDVLEGAIVTLSRWMSSCKKIIEAIKDRGNIS